MNEKRLRELAGLNEATSERDSVLMSALARELKISASKIKEGLTGKDLGRFIAEKIDSKVLKILPQITKVSIQDPEGNGLWEVSFVQSVTRIKGGKSTTNLTIDLTLKGK